MASAKPHYRMTAGGDVLPAVRAADGLRNVVTNIGTARDKSTHSEYVSFELTAEQARNAFRGSWIPRKIVNIPAQDATRRWRAWDADKDVITKIEAEERRLKLRLKVKAAMRTARLYGGGAIFIGTDQAPEEPLDAETVRRGGLKFLTVLDKRDLVPDIIVLDISSEYFGLPEFYDIATDVGTLMRVHASRLAIFTGADMPDTGAARVHPWGDSVLQAPWKALKDTDATMANLAQLVFEAKVDTIGIPGMTKALRDDPRAEQRIIDRVSLLQAGKSIANAIVHDTEEEIDQKTIQFGKMPEIMDRFFQIVSGAADIPATRFFGQSPAGMNSTGESDMRNYYDHVQEMQESSIQPALSNLDEALIFSALGNRPESIHYNWRSLWQTTEKERAEIGKTIADTGTALSSILPQEVVSQATANALIESEAMPGIEAAVDEHGLGEFEDDDDDGDDLEINSAAVGDAEPKPLYVSRRVLNGDDIVAWAKEQGFKDTLEAGDLHVTIAYSRKSVDWMKAGATWDDEIDMPAGGPRLMDMYGNARVLLIASSSLSWRHEDIKRETGATWDHGEYQPHITISYSEDSPDLKNVEPYRGPIKLGPEIFEEIKEGWAEGLD